MTDVLSPLSARSEAITRRTYNRPLDDDGSKFETWEQTVWRSHFDHHVKLWEGAGGKVDYDELDELVALGLDRSGLVSGRTLWLGGTEYGTSRASSNFNCSALNLETVYDMVDAMWLLLNGCGVGGKAKAGTLHGYYRRIPKLTVVPSEREKTYRGHRENRESPPTADNNWTWTIVVGDSAEAWAKAPGKMLVSPRGRVDELVLDFSNIRGAGGRLKGYGWICNGYKPFAAALSALHTILNRNAANLLNEEDILDIFNWFGTVLSSRRAAEAGLMDQYHPLVEQFATRKKGYYECSACGHWDTSGGRCSKCGSPPKNPQRGQSNNSILFWSRPDIDDIADLLYMNLDGGEPGFVNASAALSKCSWFNAFNPCFEICLPSHGFCVSSDTLVITKTGIEEIGVAAVEGRQMEVWNGDRWSWVTPRETGRAKPLVRVRMSDGSYLDCTPYHRFSVQGTDGGCREVYASDLREGDVTESFKVDYADGGNAVDKRAAYTLGVLVGDGYADAEGRQLDLTLYGVKAELPVLGVKGRLYRRPGYNVDCVDVTNLRAAVATASYGEIDPLVFVADYRKRPDALLPLFAWDRASILTFIAGWADTDGCETGTGGIRIYATSFRAMQLTQLLLRKCGIRSSVNLMSKRGEVTNFGERESDVWYVQITECQDIPCGRLDTSRGHAPLRKGSKQKVVAVEPLPGLHTVYCFDEPFNHKAVFGNTLTHQCNLVSVCLPSFGRDFYRLERAVWVMARANYRQTCVNLHDEILQKRWNQTNESLRLCGVSFTGVAQAGWLTDYQIRRLRNSATMGAYSMADELQMPRPKAVTTIKPEGTRSKISGRIGMEVAEGMHLPLGQYIFNWINFSPSDPLVGALEAAGYRTMPNPNDSNNVLVRFPVEYANCGFSQVKGKAVNTESAIDQLERYRRWNVNWADHNVSATISLSRSEVPEVAQWVHDNWDDGYLATAFLQRVDPTKSAKDVGQPYLPQEVVEQEVFAEAMSNVKPVDWDRFHTGWHEISDVAECAGGVCPTK